MMFEQNLEIYIEQKRRYRFLVEFLVNFFLAFIITSSLAVIAFSGLFISTRVEGASMLPTLNAQGDAKQDSVFVGRFATAKKQDMVVIKETGKSFDYIIKRLIATEGDAVNIVKVYNAETALNDYYLKIGIDGEILRETYIYQHNDIGLEDGENNDNGMFTTYKNFKNLKLNNQNLVDNPDLQIDEQSLIVPQNQIFVLGDNRGNSTDSATVGCYDIGQVLGKVVHVVKYDENVLTYFLNYYTPFNFKN